jgi:FKBP-type peptidyl-prolyl cis-trans isomerase FkpA/FKBP-type peptidyl-prolyl cis-trans isomerase FklB
MTNLPSFLTKRPSTPILIIIGGAALSLALIAWIFAPGGFLDSLTTLDVEATAELPIEQPVEPQTVELPEALSPQKNVAFLTENAKKSDVKTTASGLQYKIVKAGKGKQPGPTSMVTVHYAGKMIDGTEFDSSIARGVPAEFPLNRVIPGWTEGLQLMHEGEKVEFVIPPNLAYGPEGKDTIPPNQTLVFQVELIKVQ